jgi:phenylpropionate dioxygenase-like ring-hydroxylating dioxygenase large terminal subunit
MSKDLHSRPVSVRICNDAIVLFRGDDGLIGALEDHCPHRHVPLSMGKVCGAALQCGYHGMTFDRAGTCIQVPSQSFIPPKARVRAYPVIERYGWIWVWLGAVELADLALIPDFHWLDTVGFAHVGDTTPVAANFQLVVDNLLDLSHVGFVHGSTIGAPGMGEKGKLTVDKTARGVVVRRLVPDVPAPPVYRASGVLPDGKNIDRFQIITYTAPCFVTIHVGGAEVGTGVLDGRTEHGLNSWVLNAITPETESTATYYWANVRAHALNDVRTDVLFFDATTEAFAEDKAMVEAQQRFLSRNGDSWPIAFKADAGAIEGRRALEALRASEATTA